MHAPLLALTRRRRSLSPETVAVENMRQLVQLRWFAVVGQLVTILVVHFGLGVRLPLAPMLAIVALLALANILALGLLARGRVSNTAIFLALLFDIASLALQLSLSGGGDNPFISLFFLQVVLGAILLEPWSVTILAAVASACYAALSFYSLPLHFPANLTPAVADLEKLGAWISFALTGALLAVFISRIIHNLRARDVYMADLHHRAAEEDGIVRMGLLASGAAHELGTPLSSLSVILNDWSRMPRIADDPELKAELAEMQREVGRCKQIVGDILHSAGTPRGDEMGIVSVDLLLDDVATAWRPTHPSIPLECRDQGLEGAMMVSEPALRQTLSSLLDNAAEVSPSGVKLLASRADEGLELTVSDSGPGFTAAQLATIGKPYQSSKGVGRGLGLFFAAALAWRLGGRLTASNRPEGGADVTLILPLATPTHQRPNGIALR